MSADTCLRALSRAPSRAAGWTRFRHALCLAFGCLALLVPCTGFGAVTYANEEYLIDSWESDQGLPENSATAMVQTRDGYLWFGTFSGLVRFNGTQFTIFDSAKVPELPSTGIVNLHLDAKGRMWVSTLRGLVTLKDRAWTVYGAELGWTANYARTFSEAAGVVCITSFDGRVFRADDGKLTELTPPPGPRDGGFGYVDPKGKIWFGRNNFFGYWDGRQWVASDLQKTVTNAFWGLATARDGSLLSISAGGLLRIRDDRIVARTELKQNLSYVWSFSEDHAGTVWFAGMNDGLVRLLPSGAANRYTTANGLTYNALRFAFEDREKNLWVGSSGGGLMRFKRRSVVNYGLESGIPERIIKTVVEEAPGKMLVGTHGKGVARLENGRAVQLQPQEPRLAQSFVQSMLVDRRGWIWAGTFERGLMVDNGTERRWLSPAENAGPSTSGLFEDALGRVWIGGDKTLSVYEGGHFTQYPTNHVPRLAEMNCFADEGTNGVLWAANPSGLFRLENDVWTEVRDGDGKAIRDSFYLKMEPDGTLWLSGRGKGLRRMKQGKWSSITKEHGLPTLEISTVLDDGRGYWWLASNQGILRVARTDLDAVLDRRLVKLPIQIFTQSDGMASVEGSGGYPTAAKDSRGRLWFGTLKGLCLIDPATLQLNTNPPPVVIERVTYRDTQGKAHELPWSGQSHVTVPAGSKELEVHYAGLSYTAPEKMRFVYSLTGRGDEWIEAGARRSVWFYTPPPGTIQFRVKAANNDGVWNETGASIALIVQPFYWQTLWFRLLALSGAAGGIGFAAWKVSRGKLERHLAQFAQERALAQERARLASVLEVTSDFVSFADGDGRVLYLNAAGRRLIGLPENADISQYRVANFHSAWAVEKVLKEGMPAAIRDGSWSGETALLRRDGREIPVSQVITIHKSPDGSVNFSATIARDISDRKFAEEALMQGKASLRAFLDALPEPAIFISATGTVLNVNQAMARSLNKDVPELPGLNIYTLLPPEVAERRKALVDEVVCTGETRHLEDTNGGRRYITYFSPVKGLDGQVSAVAVFALDITERQLAEEALRQSQERLRHSQKLEALGTLSGGIAHDFNNIIAAILGFAELAAMDSQNNPPALESLEDIVKSSHRAKDLVRQILTFSRMETHRREVMQVGPVFEESIRLLRAIVPASIEIVTRVDAPLPFILADGTAIQQVLMNLVNNASQAIGARSGRIEVTLAPCEVDAAFASQNPGLSAGSFLRLTVKDNGAGMPAEVAERIFEPFFTTKKPGQGTGLGLSVVHGIVQTHQGAITVKSAPGQGATFEVFLPVARVELGPAAGPAKPLLPVGGVDRILLVDDETALLRASERLLVKLGYQVTACDSPAKALELFRQTPDEFDLVLTDFSMPGQTGVELAEKLFALRPSARILLCTGYGAGLSLDQILKLGFCGMLQKPVNLEDLCLAIRAALDTPAKTG